MNRLHHRRTFRPWLEALESRWCPTCNIELVGSTLTITGDAGDNSIVFFDNGPGDVHVDCGGVASDFSEPVEQIVVQAGNGDDFVAAGSFAAGVTSPRTWTLDAGDGNDFALVVVEGPIDAPISIAVLGGAGSDVISIETAAAIDSVYQMFADGGRGNDGIFTFHSGPVNGVVVTHSLGGNGDDFVLEYFNLLVNGTFDGHADGGNGSDTVLANLGFLFEWDPELPPIVAGFDVAAGASASYRMTGGNGHDALALGHVGRIDGSLNIVVDGGRGYDQIFAGFDINVSSSGRLSADVLGGNGDDELEVQVRFITTEPVEVSPGVFLDGLTGFSDTPPPLAELSVTADGVAGFDTCLHSAWVSLIDIEDDQPI